MRFKMERDGSYLAEGEGDWRYEITEGPHGTWVLKVSGCVHKQTLETLEECFDTAETWELEEGKE
jgi:hypothetical protein